MHVIGARWIARLCGLMALVGLSLLPAMSQAASEEDPWESFNRPIFRFNDTVDTYALKPIAQGYRAVTPQFLEDGVHNVFGNIGDVGNLANNLLQGKLHNAGVDTGRLIFNTTFGVLGFFDAAKHMGLQKSNEDFGQTLGVWGLESGPYLVIPFLGPSTVRDAAGRVPDSFLTPIRTSTMCRPATSLVAYRWSTPVPICCRPSDWSAATSTSSSATPTCRAVSSR